MRKKYFAATILCMVLVLVLGFTGCGKKPDDDNNNSNNQTVDEKKKQEDEKPPVEEKKTDPVEEEKKTEPVEEKKVELTKEEQYKINLFLSNFSEQGFENYDCEKYEDFQLINFAFTGAKINDSGKVQYIEPNEAVPEKTINSRIQRYFGKTVSPEEGKKYEHFYEEGNYSKTIVYKDGMFLREAVDGESYGKMSVADEMVQQQDGKFRVRFKIYELEQFNIGGLFIDDKNYYYTTPEQAVNSKEMVCIGSGTAVVVPYKSGNTDSYHLLKYTLD